MIDMTNKLLNDRIVAQLTRIADALEKQNTIEEDPLPKDGDGLPCRPLPG